MKDYRIRNGKAYVMKAYERHFLVSGVQEEISDIRLSRRIPNGCQVKKLYKPFFTYDPRPHWYLSIAARRTGAAPTIEGAEERPASDRLEAIGQAVIPKGKHCTASKASAKSGKASAISILSKTAPWQSDPE